RRKSRVGHVVRTMLLHASIVAFDLPRAPRALRFTTAPSGRKDEVHPAELDDEDVATTLFERRAPAHLPPVIVEVPHFRPPAASTPTVILRRKQSGWALGIWLAAAAVAGLLAFVAAPLVRQSAEQALRAFGG